MLTLAIKYFNNEINGIITVSLLVYYSANADIKDVNPYKNVFNYI